LDENTPKLETRDNLGQTNANYMLDHDQNEIDKKEVTDLNIGGSEDIADVDAPGDNDK
jgi:hypothetical protein